MGFFSDLKDKFKPQEYNEHLEGGDEEYVEIDTEMEEKSKGRTTVRPFVIQDFSDITEIINGLREGHTIALLNIKPLKDKDLIELKRAINKLKKTCDAIGGDWIVATPASARVYRSAVSAKKESSDVGELE